MSAKRHRSAVAYSAPLAPGDVLADKYRIEGVIGKGGMGVVYAGTNVQLDQRVAVKVLVASADDETVARFTREARTLAKLQDEHVSRVLDLGTSDLHGPFMVLELLEGEDFADLLARVGPLAIDEAVGYALQACEAVAEAHAHGVIHRDLKPENLFLARRVDGTEIVKVLDFGISKVAPGPAEASITGTTDVLGSPVYMSPEQLRGSRDVDERTDIWALGVTLYELIAGRRPFDSDTVADICVAVLVTTPKPLRELRPEVPEGLSLAVMRCLEKSLRERYVDVGELAEALAPFGGDSATESCERIARLLGTSGRPRVASSTAPSSGASPEPPGSNPPRSEETTASPASIPAPRPSSRPAGASNPRRAGAILAGFALALALGDVPFFARPASAGGVGGGSPQPSALEVAATCDEPPESLVSAASALPDGPPANPSAAPRARATSSRSAPPALAPKAQRSADAIRRAFEDRK